MQQYKSPLADEILWFIVEHGPVDVKEIEAATEAPSVHSCRQVLQRLLTEGVIKRQWRGVYVGNVPRELMRVKGKRIDLRKEYRVGGEVMSGARYVRGRIRRAREHAQIGLSA